MTQSRLITILVLGLVGVLGISTAVNWGLTSALIASGAVDGPQGATGPAGADGEDGKDGLDGADGAVGATGPMGPAGSGARGAAGAAGSAGQAGAAGAAGADGADAASVPPVAVSLAAGTAYLPVNTTTSLFPSLQVPAGVYALSYTISDAQVPQDPMSPTGGITCRLYYGSVDTGSSIYLQAGAGITAATGSAIATITAPTSVSLDCSAGGYMYTAPTVDLQSTGGTLTAAKLD